MMAGNPNWWSTYPPQYVVGSATSLPLNSLSATQDPPHQSWSQLLLGGLSGGGGDERFGPSHFQPKRLENLEQRILDNHPSPRVIAVDHDHLKQEISQNSNFYSHGDEEFQATRAASAAWSQQIMPVVSSPMSCVTSLSSSNTNILDFSYNKASRQPGDQSSEFNSTATGGVCKKARVHASSSQPPLKVRKEKLGDRITALHQLVSPFGKTDTASVLLEAIGYIRFLQGQIEVLSSPYLGNASSSNVRNQHIEDGGEDELRDLKSRGLCLVPVSCTQHVGSENGADYWAPAVGGGF